MAMYYYASKLSAIACGTRCKHQTTTTTIGQQQQQQHHHRRGHGDKEQGHQRQQSTRPGHSIMPKSATNPSDSDNGGRSTTSDYRGHDGTDDIGHITRSEAPYDAMLTEDENAQLGNEPPVYYSDHAPEILVSTVLGSGGIMYNGGNIMSGPQDSLVDLLMPSKTEDLDKEYIFSFLLSSRLFVRPHELLGRLLDVALTTRPATTTTTTTEPADETETEESELDASELEHHHHQPPTLDRLVGLLGIWTNTFPYDFRDERIMCHVKHIVARCANTTLGDVVSELLSALLTRLTELEQHEKELRSCQTVADEDTSLVKLPSATPQLAQMLCRIERRLAKHVGPEEFVQYAGGHHTTRKSKKHDKSSAATSAGVGGWPGVQDSKKTCNLESYLEWAARLRLLVANEVLQCTGIRERSKSVELWTGVAQYCLLVGNYNSATAILESLESPAIARLHATWSKLASTSQQLDCMQRHADGCGDLWQRQTVSHSVSNGTMVLDQLVERSINATVVPKVKSNDWVVIPVFSDIVRLALSSRDECQVKLPNGHLNVAAFNRLAAIVGAFTKHMCDVSVAPTDGHEYHDLCRHIQCCTLQTETDLMLASFDCEEPTKAEKDALHLT